MPVAGCFLKLARDERLGVLVGVDDAPGTTCIGVVI